MIESEWPTVASGTTALGNFGSSLTSMYLAGCICVSAAAFLPEWEQTSVCVYIKKCGHFGGLSNKKHDKKTERVWNLFCFFSSTWTPQDFIYSLTGVWDSTVKSISLGAGTWNLSVSILLMVIVFYVQSMSRV